MFCCVGGLLGGGVCDLLGGVGFALWDGIKPTNNLEHMDILGGLGTLE